MTKSTQPEKDLELEQIELREAVSYARSIGVTGISGVSVEILEHYFSLLDKTANQEAT